MTENLEILLEKEVSCSCCVGPGVRFGLKPQNKLLQSGYPSDFDMIHSLVEVLLLPQLISLIWFSYWLTAAPRRYAFLRLKIHTLCTSAYVIIHTLHTHCVPNTRHEHITMVYCIFTILFNTTPLFFLSLSVYMPQPPPLPHPNVFSQNGNPEAEELLYSHYVICNDTHETLRFGQVDTDENVLLASLHSHQYSWRSHKSPQVIHRHFSYPGALKYAMAQSLVVLVPALSKYAYVRSQKCARCHQCAATICVFLSVLLDSSLTALLKKIDYI